MFLTKAGNSIKSSVIFFVVFYVLNKDNPYLCDHYEGEITSSVTKIK